MEVGVVIKVDVNNPDLGDMRLDNGGGEVLLTTLSDEVAQRLFVRFEFFKGEWFLDILQGTPWFGTVLSKNPGDKIIRTVLGNVIRTTEGVESLTRFAYTIGRDRVMTLSFSCQLQDGTIFRSTDYAPFVVDLSAGA